MNKTINKDYYRSFISKFCEKLQQIPDYQPESGIFIPYTFNDYANVKKKIFFVGIDTAGWIKTSEMLTDYSNNNIDSYFEKNTKVVSVQGENQDGTDLHSLDKNTAWRCNHMSRFWPFCQKLYIYIMTGEWVNVTDFEKKHYNLLEGAAYGNLSLVEIKKGWLGTLKGYEKIDKEFVKDLRSYVRKMERFETLFEAYETPDLVIVLGERGKRMDVLEGLGAKEVESNEFAIIYELEKYRTKIIWTSHPSARRKTKSFREGVLPYIGSATRKLLGLSE